MSAIGVRHEPLAGIREETRKLGAFVRRDLKIALSYRMAAAVGLVGLASQAIVLSFIGKLVDPTRLPLYGGSHATYLEFVSIGLVFNMVTVLMLNQVATAMRTEQLIGTLESLLVTPTRITTIQTGSAAFELLWVPVRFAVFLAAIAIAFGLDMHLDGVLPAIALLVMYLPFLWGLGLLSAGAILTYRRGTGSVSAGATILSLASGAFFPVALLPHWLAQLAKLNPVAIALEGLRETLIGGAGWAPVGDAAWKLVPMSILGLSAGALAFGLALRRERRLGTLGMY
jgi:ABC-2 type transport system permease protein